MTCTRLIAWLTVLTLGHYVAADVITTSFRQGGGGTGFVDATFDGTFVQRANPDTAWPAITGTNAGQIEVRFPTQGAGNSGQATGLLAIKDLFDLLPTEDNGLPLVIHSATLSLRRSVGTSAMQLSVNRMLADWLVRDAGQNATNVTYNRMDVENDVVWPTGNPALATDTAWRDAAQNYYNDDGQRGFPLFTDANQAVSQWTGTTSFVDFDITEMLKDMYALGENFGFAIFMHNGGLGGEGGAARFFWPAPRKLIQLV